MTDLHDAANRGDVARVKLLLDQSVEVDAPDGWENTALLLACFSEAPRGDVIALLRERGADPHKANIHGETPRSKAYERFLMSGHDPLADLPAPEAPTTEAADLADEELASVVAAVHAVVDRDEPALQAMEAFDGGNPYEWTERDYGRWGAVQLVVPPGEPRTWTMHVLRFGDDSLAVDVEMWTREEGRSDLTLELELSPRVDDRRHTVTFRNLHAM